MNDEARRMGARFLATGHNLDDMAQSVMMNFVRGDIERMADAVATLTSPDQIPATTTATKAA